jgi:HSP20 family protein
LGTLQAVSELGFAYTHRAGEVTEPIFVPWSAVSWVRPSIPEGGGGQGEGPRTHATAWVPTTDIFAVGDDLVIRCELPGVRREDVEISLYGGALIVDGERKGEPEASEYYARERHYGHFKRRIKLPESIDRSDISASFEDGLLEITVKGGVDRQEPERIEIG